MHRLASSAILKSGDRVIGYTLTTSIKAGAFNTDLLLMFQRLKTVKYKDHPLFFYRFYCMGQICVAKSFWGQGIVKSLYQKHKELYSSAYKFLLIKISAHNHRSLVVHQKVDFIPIYTYGDAMDEWKVVIWDWQ